MPKLSDLPLEVRQWIYEYAIDLRATKPKYPWGPCEPVFTNYKSLMLVNCQTRNDLETLYSSNRIIDVTLFFSNIPDLYDIYQASERIRILRDAKFRLFQTVKSVSDPDLGGSSAVREDVENFILDLDGFMDDWQASPGLYQTPSLAFPSQSSQGDFRFYNDLAIADISCFLISSIAELEYPIFGKNLRLTNYNWKAVTEDGKWVYTHEGFGEAGAVVLQGKLKDLAKDFTFPLERGGWPRIDMQQARKHVAEDKAETRRVNKVRRRCRSATARA